MKNCIGIIVIIFSSSMTGGNTDSLVKSRSLRAVESELDHFVPFILRDLNPLTVGFNGEGNTKLGDGKEASIVHWGVLMGNSDKLDMVIASVRQKGVERLLENLRHRVEIPISIMALDHSSLGALSSDGAKICILNETCIVQIWDIIAKRHMGTIKHDMAVTQVAWCPNGRHVCTGSYDKTAQVWDVVEGKQIGIIQHKDSVLAAAWSADGGKICTIAQNSVRIWDVAKRSNLPTIENKYAVEAVAWSPDGTKLCTGNWDCTAQIWDVAAMSCVRIIKHKGPVFAVAWSPDGSKLCTGSRDGCAKISDMATMRYLGKVKAVSKVKELVWSPDGSNLCIMRDNSDAQIWNVATNNVVGVIEFNGYKSALAWSSDGSKICAASSDEKVHIWDVATRKIVETMEHKSNVNAVIWNHEGKICTGCDDGTVQVWIVERGTALDWAVSEACNNGRILIIDALLRNCELDKSDLQDFCSSGILDVLIKKIPTSLYAINILELLVNNCRKLDGLCSRDVIDKLTEVQALIKVSNPDGYDKIENLYQIVINKGSGYIQL